MRPKALSKKRLLAVILFVSALINAVIPWFNLTGHPVGIDFRLRYNEVLCVRSGVDPYRIWAGIDKSDVFFSYNGHAPKSDKASLPVNAYPPWAYTYMMPFTFLPYELAFRVWRMIEFLVLAFLAFWAYDFGRRCGDDSHCGFLCSTGVFLVGSATYIFPLMDNYGIVLALATLFFLHFFSEKRDFLCGLSLSILMVKPQIGMLFAVPLLVGHRWKSLFAGASICLIASIPPALLLKASPLALILQIPKYGSDVAHGSLLLPHALFVKLEQLFGQTVLVGANALAGLALCYGLTARIAHGKARGGAIHLMVIPAILSNAMWTYSVLYDRWTWAPVQVLLMAGCVAEKEWQGRLLPLFSLLGLASSGLMVFHPKTVDTWVSLMEWNALSPRTGQFLFAATTVLTICGILGACYWASKATPLPPIFGGSHGLQDSPESNGTRDHWK